MSQQVINIGAAPDDHTGDPIRTSFVKCNQNFTELYQPQRRVTAAPITVATADVVLNCNISSGSPTCTLPDASTRGGKIVVFKDSGGQFGAYNLTVTPFAGQTIDGLTSVVLATNYQSLRLRPYNDGTGTGWSIE